MVEVAAMACVSPVPVETPQRRRTLIESPNLNKSKTNTVLPSNLKVGGCSPESSKKEVRKKCGEVV